ncbi:MAG: F0F1 ATP synthase subunit B [Planctomycetota bacterium]|nr:F0F1 ATP synthase subunit B [Planctomycetota bacterium]
MSGLIPATRTMVRGGLLTSLMVLFSAFGTLGVRAEDAPKAGAAPAEDAAPVADHPADGHADAGHAADGPMTAKEEEIFLALWSLITFAVFLMVLKKFAWKPLIEGLDKREGKVFGALSEAEAARGKAQKLLEEHQNKIDRVQDQVREILAEARRDAETTKNDIIATAQREAEASRKRAIVEIERARDQALDELFDHMSKSVDLATQQVVGRSLSGADHDRLIRESLQEFASRRN